MKIAIPVSSYHRGNTSEYVQRALTQLGHETIIIDQPRFFFELHKWNFDFFFCVDSGEALNLLSPQIASCSFDRVSYWFIDFRHNKNRPERIPNDLENCFALSQRGGWIFQSQFEDWEDCKSRGLERVYWLPLAADPEIWSCNEHTEKRFDIGFYGNVWDSARAHGLRTLLNIPGVRSACAKPGSLWKEDASAFLRSCKIGFNINSFFGESYAYDVNMRAYETLSCGVPLLTNIVPSLSRIFPIDAPFLKTYSSLEELGELVPALLHDTEFLTSGKHGRSFIDENATYKHRMEEALRILSVS